MAMELINTAAIPSPVMEEMRRLLEPMRTLGDLLDWSRQLEPSVPDPVVVTQDEYTHDVLVPINGGRWLDFDTT